MVCNLIGIEDYSPQRCNPVVLTATSTPSSRGVDDIKTSKLPQTPAPSRRGADRPRQGKERSDIPNIRKDKNFLYK